MMVVKNPITNAGPVNCVYESGVLGFNMSSVPKFGITVSTDSERSLT